MCGVSSEGNFSTDAQYGLRRLTPCRQAVNLELARGGQLSTGPQRIEQEGVDTEQYQGDL